MIDRSEHMLVVFAHRCNPLDTKTFSDVISIEIEQYQVGATPARHWVCVIEHDDASISRIFVPANYIIIKVDMDTRR